MKKFISAAAKQTEFRMMQLASGRTVLSETDKNAASAGPAPLFTPNTVDMIGNLRFITLGT